MPWVLHKNLVLAAMPKHEHLDKHGWENIAILSLCGKAPAFEVIHDPRVQWWKHVPLADGQIRDLDSVVLARDTALSMLGAGYLTVIHCHAGRNRSGLVGALVIRELHNMTGEEAMDWTRQCRPRAIDNEHFEVFLRGLGRPR